MPRVHILTPTVQPGDAVTHDLLGMLRWLRRRGVEAFAYAENRHDALQGEVQPLTLYSPRSGSSRDVLIHHHSVGWEAGMRCFEASRHRRVVKYHSITPARFFRPYDEAFTRACDDGARETRRLARLGVDLAMADSAYNARELVAAGFPESACEVVPPFYRLPDDEEQRSDPVVAERLREGLTLLFVGRVAPNKGHAQLLRVLAHCRQRLGLPARLVVVGERSPRLRAYHADLRLLAEHLEVNNAVWFTGMVPARSLWTFYSEADVFVCTSEHEGFCVPLVEAMRWKVPIVARATTAVQATVGDDALAWPSASPALLAESIRMLHEQPGLRDAVTRRQHARYEANFTLEAIGERFGAALRPLIEV
jgi:glycosyltransferase involved in cell wall biosynthesis